jgi:hypothetical protein
MVRKINKYEAGMDVLTLEILYGQVINNVSARPFWDELMPVGVFDVEEDADEGELVGFIAGIPCFKEFWAPVAQAAK